MNNIYRRWVKQHAEVGIKPFGWAASEEKKSFQLNTKQFFDNLLLSAIEIGQRFYYPCEVA